MEQQIAIPGTINGDALDRFTAVHFGFGVLLGVFGTPVLVATAVGAWWELLERPLKNSAPQLFPHSTQDTATNAIVDALAVTAGCALVHVLRRR